MSNQGDVRNVLIATPSYDGKLDVWYTNALVNTVILGLQNKIIFTPIFMSYDALIQRSRNDLLAIAVENEFDGILWVDSDMEWHPQWAVDSVLSGEDAYGLPVIKKSIASESYNVKCKPENLVLNDDGLIEVESIGTGFLYMSKDAFMYLWDTSKPYVHNGQDRKWAFEVKIQDNDIISEDVVVCQKLRNGGFKVVIDPTKTCNHIGNLKYVGNFEAFIKKINN
jgi:hypothetical protein